MSQVVAAGADTSGAAGDQDAAAAEPAAATQTSQQQQQQQPGEQDGPSQQQVVLQQQQLGGLMLDAARWLLLSRRAVLSGPPGCRKPLLQLPGMREKVAEQARRRVSGSGRGRGGRGGQGGRVRVRGAAEAGVKKRTRVYNPPVPRCMSCHTCLNPQMKKACRVNRERRAKNLPFVLPRARRSSKKQR